LNRFAVLGLVILLAAVACSDQVPAPVTPTPSPRPGYPPAAATALPEGVLLVQRSPTSKPPMLAVDSAGGMHAYDWDFVFSISPDHSRAVLQRSDRVGALTVFGLLNGLQEQTIDTSNWGYNPLWSPDGQRLAYSAHNVTAATASHVWTVDLATGGSQRITKGEDYYAPAAWTATGDLLVRAPGRLLLVGDEQQEIPLPESNQILDFAVSPDGRRGAMIMGYYEEQPEHPGFGVARATGLWALDTAAGAWARLKDLGGAEWQPWIGATMSWSPDGGRLAYYETYADGGGGLVRTGLSVIDAQTGENTRLHDQGQWPHAWSRDGKYLAYSYETREEGAAARTTVGIFGPNGKTRETSLLARGMAWTAQGRLLVQTPAGLSTLDPVTLAETEVLTDEGEPVRAHLGFDGRDTLIWSPSGRYIAAATPGDQYIASSLNIIDTQEGVARLFYDRAGFYPVAWLKE